jgi:uncharacterized protein YdaU (DUF1376 family)
MGADLFEMAKSPAFQYYVKDHIASKASLTMEERGAWSTLVDHCWEFGMPIPMALAVRLVGEKQIESLRFLLRIEGDTVTFDWLEETRAKQAERAAVNAENGKKGGRGNARRSKAKSERKANANRNLNEKKPYRAADANAVEILDSGKERASKVEAFTAACKAVTDTNPSRLAEGERRAFLAYWTEANTRGRMRFEDEDYFDHGRRMDTWMSNASRRTKGQGHKPEHTAGRRNIDTNFT